MILKTGERAYRSPIFLKKRAQGLDAAYGACAMLCLDNNFGGFFMKNFGFGCMRLPMNGEQVDLEQTSKMVDRFLEEGFNYFDTAHAYLEGLSEPALKTCLSDRHPRESFILTDKLTTEYFETGEDIRPFFESQLELCGVSYFDYYLMHALNADYYKKYVKCDAFRRVLELKAEGRVKHMGISFHDKSEVLEQILSEQPEIEVVQLQINYVDYEDTGIEGRKCLEVCKKFGKPVIVMEPVKGGCLVNLPAEAARVFDELGGGSYASYAIRYTASLEGVMLVLSGMSNMAQMEDNLSYMKNFKPLSEAEHAAIDKVCEIFKAQEMIPCTACRYCTEGCPKKIAIPDLFACMNAKMQHKDWNSEWYYDVYTQNRGKASDCIKCGKCEAACPQHLKITELLESVSKAYDKK